MTAAEIRAAREALGWSQERLARALGVSLSTVWRWERGKMPAPAMLRLALERLTTAKEAK